MYKIMLLYYPKIEKEISIMRVVNKNSKKVLYFEDINSFHSCLNINPNSIKIESNKNRHKFIINNKDGISYNYETLFFCFKRGKPLIKKIEIENTDDMFLMQLSDLKKVYDEKFEDFLIWEEFFMKWVMYHDDLNILNANRLNLLKKCNEDPDDWKKHMVDWMEYQSKWKEKQLEFEKYQNEFHNLMIDLTYS